MKSKMSKIVSLLVVFSMILVMLTGCEADANQIDKMSTEQISLSMAENQPTPNDISYSLSRYNLIRRAYYLAGEFDKAKNLRCEIEKPKGYIYLFLEGVGCVLVDSVDGIVTSQQSYLTPDSEYYEYSGSYANDWLADVDGTYGENPEGIFYFDMNGEYHEWIGPYYYSETYYDVNSDTILNIIEGEFEAKP